MTQARIGVYVCHCGTNIAGVVDVQKVAENASTIPNVIVAKDYQFVCSEPGQALIKQDIKNMNLDHVIVAACTPRLHEPTFRQCVEDAGLNRYLVEITNIREQCSWVHMKQPEEATQKAMDLIRMAVARTSHLQPLEIKKTSVKKNCLIIGGGISGIQAALDLADEGFDVHLVEKSPSIGGHMAQLDKTFPTMDCSMCILAPKMVQVRNHPRINLYTYSEVSEVSGYFGNFKAKVIKHPRFVDEEKCTGCGQCALKCPQKAPNEFDLGLGDRKAIYVPFPQAVPLIYTIDQDNCRYFEKGTCRVCEKFCPTEAIDFDQIPQEIELEVGTIIVATGFDAFDPTVKEELGYGIYKNVITSLELERLQSPTGPTGGKIKRPSDQQIPKRIAFIQCIGSRDEKTNPYCSRVCCMYASKEALLIKEKIPDAELSIFYIDLRAFGKGYEEFYQRAQSEGIEFIRGKVAEILEQSDTGNLILRAEDTLLGTPLEKEFDLVVLSVGLIPHKDTPELQRILNLSTSPDGFFMEAHSKLRPVETHTGGIYIAGTAQGPKDIPDSVAQASGAAEQASIPMAQGEVDIESITAGINPDVCSECRICVSVCPYDALISETNGDGEAIKVLEVLCKGCGACGSACPAAAIQMNHYTDQQILAQLKAALEGDYQPKIVGFLCNWCSYGGADIAGTSRIQYDPNIRIIRVMCSSRVDPYFILKAFELGADGVLVAGCHPGDCYYITGNLKTMARVDLLKQLMSQLDVNPERVRLEWISAAEGQRFADTVNDFVNTIKGLKS